MRRVIAGARPAAFAERLSPLTLRSRRDAAVDVMKGVACLLMVVAHVRFAQAPWLQSATMATALFFASTGMNLAGIVERRPGQEKRLAANALFLIFAGFADNYIQGTLGMCDVFQSAGMAMLAMLLLRYLWPGGWTWLFPVPFLLHLANQHLHWKIADGGLSSFFLTPGLFPLLPWLSFYLLGAHLKRCGGQKQPVLLGTAALGGLALVMLASPFHFDKFWMSPEYFFLGCIAVAFSLAGLRRFLTSAAADRLSEVRLWGANSLVFYMLNNFTLRVLEMMIPHGVALFLLSLAITALLMRPLLQVQAWAADRRPAAILLAGAALAVAVLGANRFLWSHSFPLQTLTSFGLALAFIGGYPAWKNLSRTLETRRASRPAAFGEPDPERGNESVLPGLGQQPAEAN